MFRKFAKAEVLGYKSSKQQLSGASLNKFGSYDDYRTDDDYLYVRVRAISSRVNRNSDGWPSQELQKAYRTFLGKPIFVDHHNDAPTNARGIVVDSAIHVDDLDRVSSSDPYYASAPEEHKPPTWVELLLEVDAKTFPKLAKAIIDGDIDGVSMGCNVERSRCSVCANWATTPEQYCAHIRSKGAYFDHNLADGRKISKRSYEDCFDIGFFEISFVFDPADETALVSDLKHKSSRHQRIAAIYKEANEMPPDPVKIQAEKMWDAAMRQGMQTMQAFLWVKGRLQNLGFDPVATEDALQEVLLNYDNLLTGAEDQLGTPSAGGDMPNVPEPRIPPLAEDMQTSLEHYPQNNPTLSKNITVKGNYFAKTAADPNPRPQSEALVAPKKVDTLRKERVCQVCGQPGMENGTCSTCGWVEPPESFNDPDLTQAQQVDAEQAEQPQGAVPMPNQQEQQQPGQPPQPMPGQPPQGLQQAARRARDRGWVEETGSRDSNNNRFNQITNDMNDWEITFRSRISSAPNTQGGRINTKEKPILPVTRQNSDKPIGAKVISDSTKPVESKTKENTMSQARKTADGAGATPAGSGVSADKRVDVQGVGAVDDSPEKHTQHENVETVQNIEGTPTDTWHGNEGDSLGQHEPVTKEVDVKVDGHGIGGPIGQPVSNTHMADGTWGVPGEGSGKDFPDHEPARIDLLTPIAEPVGDGTMTFGDDPMHVGDPVTQADSNTVGGPMGTPLSQEPAARQSMRAHIFRAMRIAETEVELGVGNSDAKYQRAGELEDKTPGELEAIEQTLSRVKTAGLGRVVKEARRLPSLRPTASVDPQEHVAPEVDAEGLFM